MAAILAVPLVSLAAEFRFGEQTSTTASERISDDLYVVGGSITSAGSVEGDLVAGGGSIVISGPVSADVAAGGGNVVVLSDVGDDVRVGGGSVVIQGRVGDDVIAGGGQITIGGLGIGGDVAAGGGTVRIDAPVAGDVRISGGSVYINAPIGGAVNIEADTLTLGSRAVIAGTLTYKANKELKKEDGAVVRGEVIFEERKPQAVSVAAIAAVFSLFIIGKFLALLVCALVIGLLFKRYSREAVAKAVERPLLELGRGLVVFAALPVLSVLMLVTLVGIPFGILGLIAFVAALLFAWIVAPIIVGSVVYQYFSKRDREVSWKTILAGVFLYSILGLVPLLGWLAQALLMLLSLGTTVAIKWEIVRQWR